ncbi:MAG: hypothetical protein WCR52_02505 [Bacteroidota bacterium]
MLCLAVDAMLMCPFRKKGDGITAYAAFYHLNLGNNYYTVVPINAITSAGSDVSPINGAGTAFPTTGTGNSLYIKLGYLAPEHWAGRSRLGVFGTYQYSKLEALKDAVQVFETGINWFLSTNKVKLSCLYRNRPVYQGSAASGNSTGNAVVADRKGEVIAQLQFNF